MVFTSVSFPIQDSPILPSPVVRMTQSAFLSICPFLSLVALTCAVGLTRRSCTRAHRPTVSLAVRTISWPTPRRGTCTLWAITSSAGTKITPMESSSAMVRTNSKTDKQCWTNSVGLGKSWRKSSLESSKGIDKVSWHQPMNTARTHYRLNHLWLGCSVLICSINLSWLGRDASQTE